MDLLPNLSFSDLLQHHSPNYNAFFATPSPSDSLSDDPSICISVRNEILQLIYAADKERQQNRKSFQEYKDSVQKKEKQLKVLLGAREQASRTRNNGTRLREKRNTLEQFQNHLEEINRAIGITTDKVQ